jgi:hypothetical protein
MLARVVYAGRVVIEEGHMGGLLVILLLLALLGGGGYLLRQGGGSRVGGIISIILGLLVLLWLIRLIAIGGFLRGRATGYDSDATLFSASSSYFQIEGQK